MAENSEVVSGQSLRSLSPDFAAASTPCRGLKVEGAEKCH